jgi:hypothetical protein
MLHVCAYGTPRSWRWALLYALCHLPLAHECSDAAVLLRCGASVLAAAPSIASMSPLVVPTIGYPDAVLTGESFGDCTGIPNCYFKVMVTFPDYRISVNFRDMIGNRTLNNATAIEHKRELPPFVCTSQVLLSSECRISLHSHNRAVVSIPRGLGPFVELKVAIVSPTGEAQSAPILFNYSRPVITAVSPNPFDARGGMRLSIYGDNLGLVGLGPRPVVHLNGRLCNNSLLQPPQEPEADPRPYIECTAQNDVVGRKNVTIATGFYSVLFDTRSSKLSSSCVVGFFGNISEFCEPCYLGAECAGGPAEPVSIFGFYIGNISLERRSDVCKHPTRARCLAPRPCDPPESCVGMDQCSKPYLSKAPLYRCATCSPGYYRLAGKCRKCPKNPWIMIVGFIVVVLAAGVVGYVLNRKAVNIAFLSIGIDYFQVLAMFSRSNVKWPEQLNQFFLMLSAFNFNIDITAPEVCLCAPGLPCRAVPCSTVPCRVVPCRVVSCRVVSCRVVSCRVVSCRVVSCRVVSCRGVLVSQSSCVCVHMYPDALCPVRHPRCGLQVQVVLCGGPAAGGLRPLLRLPLLHVDQEAHNFPAQQQGVLPRAVTDRHQLRHDVLPVPEPHALPPGHLQLPAHHAARRQPVPAYVVSKRGVCGVGGGGVGSRVKGTQLCFPRSDRFFCGFWELCVEYLRAVLGVMWYLFLATAGHACFRRLLQRWCSKTAA